MDIGSSFADRFREPRAWLALSLMCCGGATTLYASALAAGWKMPLAAQAWVYLAGMVVLNLPHGAVENWLNLRSRRRVTVGGQVAAYSVAFAAFAALLSVEPVAGVMVAMAVASAKAGSGDLAVAVQCGRAGHVKGRSARALMVASRGSLVMALPVASHPEQFDAFAGIMVATVDPASMGRMAQALDATRPWIGWLCAALAVAHVARGGWAAKREPSALRDWTGDIRETSVLVALFSLVPPLVAVGLYFPFWYSARQIARALRSVPDGAWARKLATRAWAGLVGLGAATVLAALIFTFALSDLAPAGDFAYDAVAYWTLFISAVALPHVVVGGWLDVRKGIWRT